ncbi:MAG: hypothetical protein KJ077_39905 [Anaerolineae bacterium]|nr:hypothetical protein [Anaerolineae bacterium]
MKQNVARDRVQEIMTEFARLTGLSEGQTPNRYLWTDAFAVCNFLELYRQTGDEKYRQLALRLVDQVHHVLGRHRADDKRTGWISGLAELEGERHPTQGGLRIGKPLNERNPDDPFDERLEWERDGQYYHYLTQWMHALHRVSWITGDSTYHRWAIELAKTAHARFTYQPSSGSQKRMYWKMSIDLSYPLVPSMGQHDPLDGYITYLQLQATAPKAAEPIAWPDLQAEIADMAGICEGKNWTTTDPLGLGGLLADAYKVAQLIVHHQLKPFALLETLLAASLVELQTYVRQDTLYLPVDFRLAFRELGLAIGLRAVERLQALVEENPGLLGEPHSVPARLEALKRYTPLAERIEAFWLERPNREAESWLAHREINMVMLATSLAPDGYLKL